jgi:tetratricopeptide (TPR) repeat protein
MRLSGSVICAALLFVAAPGHAAWNEARSKHFVIYADENPRELHDFATKLERFDQAARVSMSMDDPEVGDGNRLTVFVVPTEKEVHEIMGDKKAWQAGLYTGRVTGSLAYVPRRTDSLEDPDALFFHEYTHHLMMQDLDRPYPEWYVEGFAEFLSTAKFDPDGSVWFGAPLQSRAWTLLNEKPPSFQQLAAGIQPGMTDVDLDAFYGRSWLLTHYLLMDKSREGQLPRYIDALTKGEPPLQAAKEVFGDLKKLDGELNKYVTERILQFRIAGNRIRIGNVDVQPLSAGGAQVIMSRAKVKYGYEGEAAEALAAEVRSIERQYPGDGLVESTLAEAELDAGHPDAAEKAAARALAANPRDTEAMVLKGRAMEEKAKNAAGDIRGRLFEQARQTFISANKLDTEDPKPLYEYYWSYLRQGIRPTDNAMEALHYASDLAPQDIGARMNSAIAYLEQGKVKEAGATLSVVAYSPHAGDASDVARRMMADIAAGDPKAALAETESSSRPASGSR